MTLYSGDWMADAACKAPGQLWNPKFLEAIGVEMGLARQDYCRDICESCPVYLDCHQWVFLTRPDPSAHMFAAGLTYRQRRRWRHYCEDYDRPIELPPACGTISRYIAVECRCDRCKIAAGEAIDGEQQQAQR